MNEMAAIATTGVLAINILLIFLILIAKQVHDIKITLLYKGFKTGFDYANDVFQDHNNILSAMEELLNFLEYSTLLHITNKDFNSGVEQAIKEKLALEVCRLNEKEGGDWYFCKQSLKFKDHLSSIEIAI